MTRGKQSQKRLKEEEALLAQATEATQLAQSIAFRVALPSFEGPLDLLLHLIREHKLDILDIPIALITQKYLEYLEVMQSLDIDIAAEFLVMAATLAHIKSRMLLPRDESANQEMPEEEGEDPRVALVRRLLEYQKYRAAGEALGARAVLGRDTFLRPVPPVEEPPEEELRYAEVSVFKLIEAFDKVLKTASVKVAHQVMVDRLSVSEAIASIGDRLTVVGHLSFTELVLGPGLRDVSKPIDRGQILVTFLALLEMTKLGMLRILQEEDRGEIFVSLRDGEKKGEINDDYRS